MDESKYYIVMQCSASADAAMDLSFLSILRFFPDEHLDQPSLGPLQETLAPAKQSELPGQQVCDSSADVRLMSE
jgi:hypothetical protein